MGRNTATISWISSIVWPMASRRNPHIRERNSFRSAFDNFCLYPRVIFFSHTIDGFTKQLRDMESINHCLGILQQLPTCLVVGCPHVHTITKHPLTLLRREQFQAS